MTTVQNQPKNQGFFGNLAFNIIIPVVLMSYASSEDYLGPAWSIVAALSFRQGCYTYWCQWHGIWLFWVLGIGRF